MNSDKDFHRWVGAAILGAYGLVKLARKAGVAPKDILQLMEDYVREQDAKEQGEMFETTNRGPAARRADPQQRREAAGE